MPDCDNPYLAVRQGTLLKDHTVAMENIHVPCGKCYNCQLRRVQHWVFRLQQEEKRSISSMFLTLTYDTKHVNISPKGRMTLNKEDFQLFMKRLRKLHPLPKPPHDYTDEQKKEFRKQLPSLKYYMCGEYGSKRHRPHYHVILFNAQPEHIYKAWTKGTIDIGQVTNDSIAYTCKYINKENKLIPQYKGDDRMKEFSLMSKNLGDNYLTPEVIEYFKKDITNQQIYYNGVRQSMPRYYRKKLYTKAETKFYVKHVKALKHAQSIEKEKAYYQDSTNVLPYETFQDYQKARRTINSSKVRKDL